MQHEVNEKSLDIEKLMQERDRLSYQLGIHATKMDNYQHLLVKHKKVSEENFVEESWAMSLFITRMK